MKTKLTLPPAARILVRPYLTQWFATVRSSQELDKKYPTTNWGTFCLDTCLVPSRDKAVAEARVLCEMLGLEVVKVERR